MSATSLSELDDERVSTLERWTRLLGGGWIFVLLIALIAIFTILRPEQFGSSFNLSMLAINAAILLVLSVGQTFVIIAGGIDLSVGTVLVFASIASAQIMLRISGAAGGTYGTTQGGLGVVFIGLIVALASGAFWGALNGALELTDAGIRPLERFVLHQHGLDECIRRVRRLPQSIPDQTFSLAVALCIFKGGEAIKQLADELAFLFGHWPAPSCA